MARLSASDASPDERARTVQTGVNQMCAVRNSPSTVCAAGTKTIGIGTSGPSPSSATAKLGRCWTLPTMPTISRSTPPVTSRRPMTSRSFEKTRANRLVHDDDVRRRRRVCLEDAAASPGRNPQRLEEPRTDIADVDDRPVGFSDELEALVEQPVVRKLQRDRRRDDARSRAQAAQAAVEELVDPRRGAIARILHRDARGHETGRVEAGREAHEG